jgi:SAM-dependent methyltransferase
MDLKNKIKQSLKSFIPEHFRKPLKWSVRRLLWFGQQYKCNVCKSSIRKFKPLGYDLPVINEKHIVGGGMRDALCPVCGSSDRIRLLLHFFREQTNIFKSPVRLLHIAPEPTLSYFFKKSPNIDYLTADINPEHVMEQMDITSISYKDHSFDAIICNHVLEHIPNDRLAMQELYRVLKPGGWAVLQVPFSATLEQTFEDPSVKEPLDRERVFGQKDHVRIYGIDYRSRLEEAGFKVNLFLWIAENGFLRKGKRMKLNPEEPVFFCTK